MDGHDQTQPPAVEPVRIEIVERTGQLYVLPYAQLPDTTGSCRYELIVESRGAGSNAQSRQAGDVPPQSDQPLARTVISAQPGGTLATELSVYCGKPEELKYHVERDFRTDGH